jgi:hypothetical protein
MSEILKIVITDSKLNAKYYTAKKFKPDKPRVKEADIANLNHYCDSEGITVSVVGNTITLSKAIDGPSKTIEFDGRDTGGQFIRLAVTYMINYEGGRKTEINPIEMPILSSEDRSKGKKGKATMLMVQMIKMTLRIGQIATFKYGDVQNSDARHISEMPSLFDMLRKVFGISFRLDDDGEEIYTLHRLEDIPREEFGLLEMDNHMVDEVIFTAISLWSLGKDIPEISIETPVSKDYHIDAMIKFARGLGMTIEDSKPIEGVKEWVWAGGTRMIKILV